MAGGIIISGDTPTQTFLKRWTLEREATNTIIIHARLTPDNPLEMDRWFRRKGYLQCGFHYCITRSGITETRDHQTVGAHLGQYDETSVGVGILGWDGKHPDTLDPLAKANFLTLMQMLAREYPHATIHSAPEFLATKGGYEPLIELATEANEHVRKS
jgi:hypothetical protein